MGLRTLQYLVRRARAVLPQASWPPLPMRIRLHDPARGRRVPRRAVHHRRHRRTGLQGRLGQGRRGVVRVLARAGRERGDDHRRGHRARTAGAGRDHRAGDRAAGVQPAQHQPRRPGLARPVPAAALAGLGHAGGDPGPDVLGRRVLRPPGQGARLHAAAPHRRRAARAAQRLPAGLRQARAGRRAARRRPHRPVRGHADLRGPPGRDPGDGP